MNDTELREGIAAYAGMQDEIREFLSTGEKSQFEFDDHFSLLNTVSRPAVAASFAPETFVIPLLARGAHEYLFVAQVMMRLGDVLAKDRDSAVHYSLPSPAGDGDKGEAAC